MGASGRLPTVDATSPAYAIRRFASATSSNEPAPAPSTTTSTFLRPGDQTRKATPLGVTSLPTGTRRARAGGGASRDASPRCTCPPLVGSGSPLTRCTALLAAAALASTPALARNFGARPARLRKANGDGLFAARYLFARSPRAKFSPLSLVHRCCHLLARGFWIALASRLLFRGHVSSPYGCGRRKSDRVARSNRRAGLCHGSSCTVWLMPRAALSPAGVPPSPRAPRR